MRTIVCCLFVLVCAAKARLNLNDWGYLVEKELRALRDNEAPFAVKRQNTPGCYHVADIGLVIDSSSSIREDDFKKGQKFVANFADGFTIGPDDVRFAAITFSDGTHNEDAIRFTDYTDKDKLINAITNIKHHAGPYTATWAGITYMKDKLMPEARDDVAHFGIVITDGDSQEPDRTAEAAHKAREAGIVMIAVGIGSVKDQELQNIASGPHFILRAESYEDLSSITASLMDLACKVLTTPVPKTEPCGLKSPADVYFLYDERQLGPVGVGHVGEFVETVTELQNFHGMHYGAISVCDSKTGFNLNGWEFPDVEHYFDNAYFTSASTLLGHLNDDAFSEGKGHRTNARKIAVLFIDGKLDDIDAAKAEAQKARAEGIDLYVVNMGAAHKSISSLVTDSRFLIEGDGYSAFEYGNDFIHRLCEGVENILDF